MLHFHTRVLALGGIIAALALLALGVYLHTLPDTLETAENGRVSSPDNDTDTAAILPYGTVTLRSGDAVAFEDMSLQVRNSIADSRCPSDVVCIWAGTVTVDVDITAKGKTETKTLELGKTVHSGTNAITLTHVDPYPETAGSIETTDYAFTLTIEKNS